MSGTSTHLDRASGTWLSACPMYDGRILLPHLVNLLRERPWVILHLHQDDANSEFILFDSPLEMSSHESSSETRMVATIIHPSRLRRQFSAAGLGLAPFTGMPQPWLGGLYCTLMTEEEAEEYGIPTSPESL